MQNDKKQTVTKRKTQKKKQGKSGVQRTVYLQTALVDSLDTLVQTSNFTHESFTYFINSAIFEFLKNKYPNQLEKSFKKYGLNING